MMRSQITFKIFTIHNALDNALKASIMQCLKEWEMTLYNTPHFFYRGIIKKSYTPFVATHTGEMLKDELKERGISQKQLSEQTGIKPSVISETVNGKRSVSLCRRILGEITRHTRRHLMNMQTQYDLDSAKIAERDSRQESVNILIPTRDHNLLAELVRKFGWAFGVPAGV